ncbi:retinal pigment epithelial membrane protein [Necator americanus]|uniref:Retinal pigment epithelial membrane protein n=1 Tax=Necator americanus TaxID=51031 RepID=W2SGK2_NECAM|nr:retinal pigment epithelial membrane protein [Necator americanus]ETN68725.1 retinal pigment epithelial membrane protein [Necator americanus]
MLRNGPGMFKIGDTEYKHWFDGLAYIQRYHFADGKMYYSARFLESEQYKESMKAQRIIYTAFGTRSFPDPCKKLYGRYVNICDLLKITLHTYTAHCHSDTDGNIWNIGSQFGPTSNYIFAKTVNPLHIKGSSNSHSMEGTELLGMIPATDPLSPSYYHSFAVTEDFFVLFETPERIDVCKLVGRDTSKMSLNECMFWDENAGVDVIIFDRITRKKVDRKVTSDAFFTFHHANAYQKDGYLIIDYCKIISPGNFDDLLLEHMRDGTFRTRNPNLAPYLHRMIVPMQINENSKPGDDLLTCCSFANGSFEFPRYCYDLNMKDYRYVYGACILDSKLFKNGVVKADLRTGTSKVWLKDAEDQLCAEPILVNRPGYAKEDEGVLIVPVITTRDNDHPYVVILDAETMEEQARFTIPQSRIPFGFHAHYTPSKDCR